MDNERNIDDDYKYSRATYYELLDKGRESLDLMMEVARQSEHPRAFEVLSNMMKQMAEINDRLMDLNKKEKDIKAKALPEKAVTNNNVFLTTVDLQRMLLKSDNVIDVESAD